LVLYDHRLAPALAQTLPELSRHDVVEYPDASGDDADRLGRIPFDGGLSKRMSAKRGEYPTYGTFQCGAHDESFAWATATADPMLTLQRD
jgi:hypothetical protein